MALRIFRKRRHEQERKFLQLLRSIKEQSRFEDESQKILIARLLIEKISRKREINDFSEVEFKVFSQFGDDGIIQWLISNLSIDVETFVEFGVEDYQESTTRFLMMNNNWSGLVFDGSEENIRAIHRSKYYPNFDLVARPLFVTRDNINSALLEAGMTGQVGLLHIDIDGNDYWIWKEINVISPIIVVLEYNSIFGAERAVSTPYSPDFYRTREHYSNLYFGASLRALCDLSTDKGYAFIGCNSAGNNAYFVRKDKLPSTIKELSVEEGYVYSKFRESRDKNFRLNYLSGMDRFDAIKGLKVINTRTGQLESL